MGQSEAERARLSWPRTGQGEFVFLGRADRLLEMEGESFAGLRLSVVKVALDSEATQTIHIQSAARQSRTRCRERVFHVYRENFESCCCRWWCSKWQDEMLLADDKGEGEMTFHK